jgi:hypothetical protein
MSTRGLVYIGTTPSDEVCAQTGAKHYDWARYQRLECRAYIQALKRVFGEPPEGCKLFVASCPHDFGSYHEVQCGYDVADQAHLDYAIKVEEGLRYWDEADMWAPVLYHPDNYAPFDVLDDRALWDRKAGEGVADRPRGKSV